MCLLSSERSQYLNQKRFDLLSIPKYIIKKNPYRGARHVNSKIQRKYHQARVCLRKASILHGFQESSTYRASQLALNWDEQFCKELNEPSLDDHSYVATRAERERHENNWVLTLNTQGTVGSKRLRPDYPDALRQLQELRSQDGDEIKKNSQQSSTTASQSSVHAVK